MQHGLLLRIIFRDGLKEIGAYNAYRSTQYYLALAGFQRRFYKDNIVEIFAFEGQRWSRKKGNESVYDQYIQNGGEEWPNTFFEALYTNDI